jgi:hypothetical protein
MTGADRALREHLEREHGRNWREIEGLPLAAVHRFEHVEQEMGLIELGHRHADAESPVS